MTKPELKRKIALILKQQNIYKPENDGARQGFEKALEILNTNQKDLSGIAELETTQARAIAKFAVDFNNMRNDGQFFVKLGEIIEGRTIENDQFFKDLWELMDKTKGKL